MNANEIALQLVKEGISVEMRYVDDNMRYYIVSGFYKSDGEVYLTDTASDTVLYARYSNIATVESLADVIRLSYGWYERSKDRFDGWAQPSNEWAKLYTAQGFGELVTKTVTTWQSK